MAGPAEKGAWRELGGAYSLAHGSMTYSLTRINEWGSQPSVAFNSFSTGRWRSGWILGVSGFEGPLRPAFLIYGVTRISIRYDRFNPQITNGGGGWLPPPVFFSTPFLSLRFFSETLPYTSWLFISSPSGAKISKKCCSLVNLCTKKWSAYRGFCYHLPRSQLLEAIETKF